MVGHGFGLFALALVGWASTAAAQGARHCAPMHGVVDGAPVALRIDGVTPADGLPKAGRLVISHIPPTAAEAFVRNGVLPFDAAMAFIGASRVYEVPSDALRAGEARCSLPEAPEGTRAVALLEPVGQFWAAAMGGSPRLVGVVGDDGIALKPFGFPAKPSAPAKPADGPPKSRHCTGPRFVHLAAADPAHHACALLPAGHDPSRRYPTIYMLSGLTGDDTNRFGWDGFVALTDAIAKDTGPAIYIGVNTDDPAGSLYPTEASSKPWLDWLTVELAATAEQRLGADPKRRALMGQSTGGFNAITVAMLRPGIFGSVAASAPDALDLRGWLYEDDHIDPRWLAWMRLERAVGGPGQMVSYAAAWSPDGRSMPADLATGEVRPDVMKAWLEHSPYAMLDDPARQAALRGLDGHLHFAVADNDDFGLTPPAQRFAKRLDALGIRHDLAVDHGGHFGLDKRLPVLFRAMLRDLGQ